MHTFCQETKADYSQFIPALFRGMINLMNDSDELVVEMSWNALNAVTKVTINTVACFGPSVCKQSRRECRALAQSDKRREAGDGSLPLCASATCLLVFLRNWSVLFHCFKDDVDWLINNRETPHISLALL